MVHRRVVVPLQVPQPFDAEALLVFLGRHAVPGVEAYRVRVEDGVRRIDFARTLRLASGPAAVELSWSGGGLTAQLHVSDLSDVTEGRRRLEQLCDLGRNLDEIDADLRRDPHLAPLVGASPGLAVPGTVDVPELLIRTLLGQQISLASAASCGGKLVARFGTPYDGSDVGLQTVAGLLTSTFPTPAALAAADPGTLPMPAARGRALVGLAEALATGAVVLTPESEAAETRARLLALRGIGPWTADYVLMRGLHSPDVLLASDLVIKRELERRGSPDTSRWAPWRSYATMHLWRAWTG